MTDFKNKVISLVIPVLRWDLYRIMGFFINMETFSNIIGNVGVVCFLLAYFLLQKGKILHTSTPYLSLNLLGSLLVLFSLIINWNLPAFLLEIAWAFISAWGLYQNVYLPNRKKK